MNLQPLVANQIPGLLKFVEFAGYLNSRSSVCDSQVRYFELY
jgi:hypothetical protein